MKKQKINSSEFAKIISLQFEGREEKVSYVETLHVDEGVECEVYSFDGDSSKDLGIIKINPGCKTPLQKVLKGDRTIEGYIKGNGRLTIIKPDGQKEIYAVGEDARKDFSIEVKIGELMQWEASEDSALVAYEICFPPYENGRYENIK